MPEAQVICARRCGFRVHDRYFEQKKQFTPGMCPRSNCGGPLEIVEAWTDTVILGATMGVDPTGKDFRKVVVP